MNLKTNGSKYDDMIHSFAIMQTCTSVYLLIKGIVGLILEWFNLSTNKPKQNATFQRKISPRCPFCAAMCKALLPFCASVAANASFMPGPPQSFMISSISATDLPQRKAECTWKPFCIFGVVCFKEIMDSAGFSLKMTQPTYKIFKWVY